MKKSNPFGATALGLAASLVLTFAAALPLSGQATPVYRPGALEQLLIDVRLETDATASPVVILDLDDTLVDTRARSLRIFRELAVDPGARAKFPAESTALYKVELSGIRYQLEE